MVSDQELVADVGVGALGAALMRAMRRSTARSKPQLEFGQVTEDLSLLPDSWGALPFAWGRYSVANHLELHEGDRVTVSWMNGRPLVQDLVGQSDEDDRNADHTRRRVLDLERRVEDLEQRLAAHLAGHP